ncbi:MAG: biotin/lipoyl-containing protein [Pararobbsia sp.]
MASEAVRIACLESLATSEGARAIAARETHAFRLNILSHSRNALFAVSEIPWVAIADFVNGKSETVLTVLATPAAAPGIQVGAVEVLVPSDYLEPQVIELLVNIGDSVQPGDVLLRMEESKIVVDLAAETQGVVAQFHVGVGDRAKSGQRLLTLNRSAV